MYITYEFPEDFIWGTAISAYQTEGYNTNTNWWRWEQEKKPYEPYPLEKSGGACDFYNRYETDFDLCKEMHNNAIRLSIEWARIEPEEGKFDENALKHYKEVLKAAKSRGLKTFVTLHHFTNPLWFEQSGGWTKKTAIDRFARYVEKCTQNLYAFTDTFFTINEPQVYALMSFINGIWPPAKHNLRLALSVQLKMMRAHKKAYKKIKSICSVPVGIVKNIVWYETDPFETYIWDKTITKTLYFLNDFFYLKPLKDYLDLIGLNYYFTSRIKNFRERIPTDYVSDLGWWINPGGLENVLLSLKKYNLPIYVTENGLADAEDKYREHFLRDMLISCSNAIKAGVDVKGYFYWSLLDNYEWHQGYWPKFGLIQVDFEHDLRRIPRKSFYYYADICKNNRVIC